MKYILISGGVSRCICKTYGMEIIGCKLKKVLMLQSYELDICQNQNA